MNMVIRPTLNGMKADGHPYLGFLYAGLMIMPDGMPKVIEYNCRMGDPETQPIMARLKSDLVPLIEAAIDGRLDEVEAEWDRRTALGVVVAASGYPDSPRKGDPITKLPADTEDCVTFHAGTALDNGQLVTSGGRVLCVTALGDSVRSAQKRAYEAVAQVAFDGMQYRRDIGYRAVGSAYSREVLAATLGVGPEELPEMPFTPVDPLIVGRKNPVDRSDQVSDADES